MDSYNHHSWTFLAHFKMHSYGYDAYKSNGWVQIWVRLL
jgi:hypothetical protein